MIAPTCAIVMINRSIIKKFKKMSKIVSHDKMLKTIPNTSCTYSKLFELVLQLMITDSEIVTVKEALYRRSLARAYYNLVCKFA